MTLDELEQTIAAHIAATFAEYRKPPVIEPVALVSTAGELQDALDAGGTVAIVPGAALTASRFIIRRSGTRLLGQGARLTGSSGPALHVLPSTYDIYVRDIIGAANYGTVFQAGNNDDSQVSLSSVPRRIVFERCSVPTHRQKRGFEINAADVQLVHCEVRDTWDVALRDSQAICILNTPGPVLVHGGYFEAGSENVLIGGDTMKLTGGVVPSDLTFEQLTLRKPLSWRTDDTKRMVKNIFEVKTGERVLVRDVLMDGCWPGAGQAGYALMITPRSGGYIRDVVFDRLMVINVSGGANILGANDKPPATLFRTTGIIFKNSVFVITKKTLGGNGYVAMLSGSPGTVEFDNVIAISDNTYGCGLYLADQQPMDRLIVQRSFLRVPYYNRAACYLDSSQPSTIAGQIHDCDISENVMADPSARCKAEYPDNRAVTVDDFTALVASRLPGPALTGTTP